jgi:2'-5' RNA ligase
MPAAEEAKVRSFIAVDLSPPVRAALGGLLEQFRRLKCDVRWVRAEGVHVTLKFLGWVDPARLERVYTALAAAVDNQPALPMRVHGLGAFPSLHRPRVLWVGLESEGLAELAAHVEEAVNHVGFEPEKRAFTPHTTLGRVNGMHGWSGVEELFKAHLSDDFGECIVDAVTIYRSTLRPEGAVYTPLWTIPLSRNKGGTR